MNLCLLCGKMVFSVPAKLSRHFLFYFSCTSLSLHIATMSSSHTTGPSPSRNNGGESGRNAQNGSSTPMLRSRTQIVTPAATTNEHTASSMGAHRQSHRRSKRSPSLEKLTAPSHYFNDRQNKITCLKFGLDHNNNAHRKVICAGCFRYIAHRVVLTDEFRNVPNNQRNDKRQCEQPWHISNERHREGRKMNIHQDFLALFDVDEPEVCSDTDIKNKNDSTQPPPSKRRRVQTKQKDAVMEDYELLAELPPPPPPIFDEGGHFTKDAMEVIRTQLSSSYKSNDNPPNEDDMRVAGMLMLWIFKHSNNDSKVSLAKLSSFPSHRQFTVAKVPTTYDTEATARQTRERTKKASDWIDALMEGNFDTTDVLVNLLDKNSKKKLPLNYIIKEWNANYRFDVDTTLAALKFSGINPTQAERLMQFTDVETRQDGCVGGIRWLAPVKQIYKRKKEIVAKSFVTRRHKKVPLSAWVTKDKKKQAERLIECSVASVRLEEVVFTNLVENRRSKRFVKASKRYKEPVQWDGETALYKISTDGGAGSNKHAINPVNVSNPQGQEHLYVFLEYSRAKDTNKNLKTVYETHPEIKMGIEDICNRRIVLLEVRIGNKVGSCMVINTDKTHNYKCPSRLPELSETFYESTSQQLPTPQPLEKYSTRIDFATVKKTKLIRNNSKNCYEGLMYEDEEGNNIGTSFFSTPLNCTSEEECTLNQVLVMGVFSSDLALLCTIFGHQGAKAMWFCLFCLMKQSDAKNDFDGTATQVEQRTLEKLQEYGRKYCEEVSKVDKAKQGSKFIPNITQNMTYSVTNVPLLDIPLDCVTYATMHVVLGLTKWLVEVTISGYEHIEAKAAAKQSGGDARNDGAVFREEIELTLKKLQRYVEFLDDQAKDAKSAVVSHNAILDKIATLSEELGAILEGEEATNSAAEPMEVTNTREEEIRALLESLRLQIIDNNNNSDSDEDSGEDSYCVKYLQMVLEQRCITNETIKECEEYLKDHSSNAYRVFTAVMKQYGVDQTTYFQGSIVGNHCMTFGEKSKDIYGKAAKELEPIIGVDDELKRELHAFTDRLKSISGVWFKIMRVMKSVEIQSDEAISQFQQDTVSLRDQIYKLVVTDVPISGWKKKLTRSMKAHLLFGLHLLKQLQMWGTLGGIDEQNIETCHAIWNKLLRQFGATRGNELQTKVLSEYLFQTSPFLHCAKDHVKKETKSKSKRKKNTNSEVQNSQRREEVTDVALVDNNVVLGPLATSINGEEALHRELVLTGEVVDEVTDEVGDEVADDVADEVANDVAVVNSDGSDDDAAKKVTENDTMIKICNHPGCGKLRLAMAWRIHQYECHEVKVIADTNSGEDMNVDG